MKHLILTLTFILMCALLSAQDFAPIGAEWYYNEQFAFSGDIDYIKFTSEKDTIINGENCRKITKRHKLECYDRPDVEFLFARNDTVFFFDQLFNEFQILYILNANKNDSWIIKIEDENENIDSINITVDSVKTRVINGVELKSLHVTYNTIYADYTSEIIEKIGDVRFMFNWEPWKAMACDANYTSGLRCYQDFELGLFSTGIVDSCDYYYKWTGINNVQQGFDISIYPNPTDGFIQINLESERKFDIEIYDLVGNKLMETEFNNDVQLNLNSIKTGFYILTLKYNGKIIESRKLLKE